MTWPALVALFVETAYFTVLTLLALYGLHRLSLVWIYLRRGPSAVDCGASLDAGPDAGPVAAPPSFEWPLVTVQLPIYNEYYVVERLIDAACAIRYPAGRLEIQVLDDSTDGTSALAAGLTASYRARGRDIQHIRRTDRTGYKAGALGAGLSVARGELLAIFDADFVPTSDFLERTVPRFMRAAPHARLGMVQARWGHINRDYSLLTRAQALLLDGHFVIEHGAREAAGRFINFNGTAGIFRRECIEQAGGWHDDTLTEDLDLSYRAQLAGWRFEYMADLAVPAELPVELNSLRSQQRRWVKGSIQTAMKLTRRVLAAPLPGAVKLEAVAHLTNNAAYLLLALLAILIVPALAVRGNGHEALLWLDLPLFLAGTGSFVMFCAVAQRASRNDWLVCLLELPAMMAIGIGLCLNNALAVIEALRRRPSEFHRTPKFRIGAHGESGPARALPETGPTWGAPAYKGPRSWLVIGEAAFAVWFAAAIVSAWSQGRYASLPFLLLFESGFLYVTGLSLAQELSRRLSILRESSHPAEAPVP